MIQHFRKKAMNKASEDRRKGAKQGQAIVEWMRRTNGTNEQGKDKVPTDKGVEGVPGEDART